MFDEVKDSHAAVRMMLKWLEAAFEAGVNQQNGVIWEEFIQYLRFFSGPVFFLGIKSENGEVRGWKEDTNAKEIIDHENGLFYI